MKQKTVVNENYTLEEPLKKLERIYPANTTVLCLENHLGERGYECAVFGCRDVWFYGDGDVRDFNPLGTVCAVHGYLIPRMSYEELGDNLIYDYDKERWYSLPSEIYHDNRYEIDMFPTVIYTSHGKRKEFISSEGRKRKDELEEFLRSRK